MTRRRTHALLHPPLLALLAGAAAATLMPTAAARAQSSKESTVSIYGLIDLGVEYRTRSNTAGKGTLRVNSGGLNTSRLGLKGKEDLGGGLSAQFNLESEILADTGAADTSAFFGRQAWVGLDHKGLGGLSMGRMSTVAYDFTIGHDFMAYAPQYSWVTKTASVPAPGFTSRISNAVRYLGKFGPFKVGANVGLGEVSDSVNANTSRGISVGYDAGPVSVQLSLDDGRSGATDTSHASTSNRSWIASGTYSLNTTKLYAGLRDTQRRPVGAVTSTTKYHSTLLWLGASTPLSDAVTVSGGVYRDDLRDTNSDPMMIAGKLQYNLSKRTWWYVTAAVAMSQSDSGNSTPTGVYRDQTPVSNHQSGVGVGVQHRF